MLLAAGKGDNAKVEELLGKGANVNFQETDGRTALIEAVYNNHADTVKLLLDKGADPNKRKGDGATALSFARKYPPITEMLKKAGAQADANPEWDIALLAAASKGDLANCKALVEKGANANYVNESGSTPLIEATYGGHAEVVKYLLDKGADPNKRKKDGMTALSFAGKYPVVAEALRNAGAK